MGFKDCDLNLTRSDGATGSFVGNVHPSLLSDEHDVGAFHGRYEVDGGHILTVVVVPKGGRLGRRGS